MNYASDFLFKNLPVFYGGKDKAKRIQSVFNLNGTQKSMHDISKSFLEVQISPEIKIVLEKGIVSRIKEFLSESAKLENDPVLKILVSKTDTLEEKKEKLKKLSKSREELPMLHKTMASSKMTTKTGSASKRGISL